MGGSDALATVKAGAGILGLGKSVADESQNEKRNENANKGYQAKLEQTDLRREATYRENRAMLKGAIQSYYKAQGWPLPADSAPGAGTSRPLPGDAPLYPEYDINPSEWSHENDKKTPEQIAAEEESSVIDASQAQELGRGNIKIAPQTKELKLDPVMSVARKVGARYGEVERNICRAKSPSRCGKEGCRGSQS